MKISFLLVSTLLATATAVRIPYRYNPEARPQGWPLREAYLSDLDRAYMASGGGEVETMQEEAIQQASVTHSIGVDTLKVGQTVKVTYIAPDKGRVYVNLLSNNDHVLHADTRYDWYGWIKTLNLNSAVGKAWQQEERPSGFPFGDTIIHLYITAKKNSFEIGVNGVKLADYKYRDALLPGTVNKIQYRFEDTGANTKAKLDNIAVSF